MEKKTVAHNKDKNFKEGSYAVSTYKEISKIDNISNNDWQALFGTGYTQFSTLLYKFYWGFWQTTKDSHYEARLELSGRHKFNDQYHEEINFTFWRGKTEVTISTTIGDGSYCGGMYFPESLRNRDKYNNYVNYYTHLGKDSKRFKAFKKKIIKVLKKRISMTDRDKEKFISILKFVEKF